MLYLKRINDQDTGTVGTARNDSATIKNVPDQIDICNFGNSHSFYALNYEDVQDHACFSFALPDQSLRDDLQIFKSFKDHITSGAIIFISIAFSLRKILSDIVLQQIFIPDFYLHWRQTIWSLYLRC